MGSEKHKERRKRAQAQEERTDTHILITWSKEKIPVVKGEERGDRMYCTVLCSC